MYDFKPQKTEDQIKATGAQMQLLQAMSLNRKARREFSKANNGIKIPGSLKPIINNKQ